MFGLASKRALDDALAIIARQAEQIAALRRDLATARDGYGRELSAANHLRDELAKARSAVIVERNKRQTQEAQAERRLAALVAKTKEG